MTAVLHYQNDRLHLEGIDLAELTQHAPTPCYVYSAAGITTAAQRLLQAVRDPRVKAYYALKANSNLAVVRLVHGLGLGMDIVSGGELARALAAGVPGREVVFSGVGKTEAEIAAALDAQIHQFNAESVPELAAISRVAASKGVTAAVALRINPDVEADTHAKISTGREENKFGINWAQVETAWGEATRLPGVQPVGLTQHIGSQITSAAPFDAAFARMEEMVRRLRAQGATISRVGLGGGIGIPYHGEEVPVEAIGASIRGIAARLDCAIELEPGRLLVGEAGVLLTRVIYLKEGTANTFLIVDAGMNDLIRPTLYEAHHPMQPVLRRAEKSESGGEMTCDVVGPVCETGDYLALGRKLPRMAAGDLLAVTHAGAYGAVMGSMYNSRALASEVLVSGHRYAIIRRAIPIEEQLGWEYIPDWAAPAVSAAAAPATRAAAS